MFEQSSNSKPARWVGGRHRANKRVADREGFEPSRRLPAYTRSRRAPSTTRPPVLKTGRVTPASPNLQSSYLAVEIIVASFQHKWLTHTQLGQWKRQNANRVR